MKVVIKERNKILAKIPIDKSKSFADQIVEAYMQGARDFAIRIGVEALEKQIPMEHHHTRIDHIVNPVRMSVCPSCLAVIPSHRTEYPNYCIRCGQHIDWSDKE